MKAILILIALSTNIAYAKKVKRVKKADRAQIESIRYNKEANRGRSEKLFLQNVTRNCNDELYHKKDRDLTVTAIYKTYPVEFRVEVIKDNIQNFCLRNFIKFRNVDKELYSKDDLLKSAQNEGGRYWPYKYEKEMLYLIDAFAVECRQGDYTFLNQMLKTYYHQVRESNKSCIAFHKNFEEKCEKYKFTFCVPTNK